MCVQALNMPVANCKFLCLALQCNTILPALGKQLCAAQALSGQFCSLGTAKQFPALLPEQVPKQISRVERVGTLCSLMVSCKAVQTL